MPTISGMATMRAQVSSVGRVKNIGGGLCRLAPPPHPSSRLRGLKRRSSSNRKVSTNFHGFGSRDTSPKGAARRTARWPSGIVSRACRGWRSTHDAADAAVGLELDLEHRDGQQRLERRAQVADVRVRLHHAVRRLQSQLRPVAHRPGRRQPARLARRSLPGRQPAPHAGRGTAPARSRPMRGGEGGRRRGRLRRRGGRAAARRGGDADGEQAAASSAASDAPQPAARRAAAAQCSAR